MYVVWFKDGAGVRPAVDTEWHSNRAIVVVGDVVMSPMKFHVEM